MPRISLTSPTWTDPSGSYTATLDAFDRQVALLDPILGTATFTRVYRADGQPASLSAPNGTTTAYAYNTLGRETARTTTAGVLTRAAYVWTCAAADPDRLQVLRGNLAAQACSGHRTGLINAPQTSAIAQTVNDQNGSVITSIGVDWTGEHRLDWTGSGQNVRSYGTNAHHDLTWTADATGAVSTTLRYDPWGTLTSSTGTSLPAFRFQGSWADPAGSGS